MEGGNLIRPGEAGQGAKRTPSRKGDGERACIYLITIIFLGLRGTHRPFLFSIAHVKMGGDGAGHLGARRRLWKRRHVISNKIESDSNGFLKDGIIGWGTSGGQR